MKIQATLMFTLFSIGCAPAQTRHWNATVKVIDEAWQPVAGAKVEMSWNVNAPDLSTVSEKIEGLTDRNGVFRPSHEANRSIGLGFTASKEGYYFAQKGYELAQRDDNDPAKWNPAVTLLLKKMIKPIPMYAKIITYSMPTNDKPVGLDLVAGDWVEPYGKGEHADILFTTQLDKRSENDYDYKLSVSFPNAGDGIQGFAPADGGSSFRSPHDAPENGYEPEAVKADSKRPGGYSNYIWNEKTNFFLRVQTVLDEHGNVKSALYGKIYGDFNRFRYYLNPIPNDRNVEFDPKRNLMKNLKPTEQVSEP